MNDEQFRRGIEKFKRSLLDEVVKEMGLPPLDHAKVNWIKPPERVIDPRRELPAENVGLAVSFGQNPAKST